MNMTQEDMIRAEVARQMEQQNEGEPSATASNFSGLAGMLTGGVAGYGAINPVEAFIENRKLKNATARTSGRDSLEVLQRIHTGELTWDDIEDPQQRETLRRSYKANQAILNDPKSMDAVMGTKDKYKVYNLADAVDDDSRVAHYLKHRARMKRKPDFNILKNPARLGHPSVAVGSLAGMAGGYYLADQLAKNKHTEM